VHQSAVELSLSDEQLRQSEAEFGVIGIVDGGQFELADGVCRAPLDQGMLAEAEVVAGPRIVVTQGDLQHLLLRSALRPKREVIPQLRASGNPHEESDGEHGAAQWRCHR
jgi:hypothetical protein